ncbi:MAG: hypothetical protein DHS20C01_00180 [marine bacterium B5-7]|nr:MAG: hypothetical protein DHS20C01_00180 [marine bacterium B5-7]
MNNRPTNQDNDDEGKSFLGRWSKNKLANQQSHDATNEEAIPAEAQPPADETSPDDVPKPQVLTDDDMPDVETITGDSVVADFFSPGVSKILRRKALRKLFHSEVFNIRDGLNDYDDDYTKFEKLGNVITADMRHRMEMEAKRLSNLEEEAQENDMASVPSADIETTSETVNDDPPPDNQKSDADTESEHAHEQEPGVEVDDSMNSNTMESQEPTGIDDSTEKHI